ncbi:MAG: S-methyl-5-thioribose-1-phosphate isomerase, partial [Pseudomonadales bacterium]|nr:S-methyl-5-thioribose-1-phosphate isomerase [Pseudomonadales bacterium]
MTVPSAIVWEAGRLRLLDQRRLPTTVEYLDIDSVDSAFQAIRTLAVRGAPAIGIAAAYALALSMQNAGAAQFRTRLEENARRLKSARPTAVNLAWAVDRLLRAASRCADYPTLAREAEAIHQEDRALCRAIGQAGRVLITPGCRVLTHCNAGALAVSEFGTATAPLYLSHQEGVPFRVYADETRPLLQGARLTAWELGQAGIDVHLLCDNAAASLMAGGGIDLVLVGTDRVTANGDVINKIGTLNLAILCNYYNIPFYVACPASTFDPDTSCGADVVIEQRDPEEVIGPHTAQVPVYNPAFDV